MTAPTTSPGQTGESTFGKAFSWRHLVFAAGLLATMAMGAESLAIGDMEGGVVTVGFAAFTWLTRVRRGTWGAIGMILVSAITLYFMLGAALTNIWAGSALFSVFVSSTLAAVALLALTSAIGFLIRRDSGSATASWALPASAALLLTGLLVWGVATGRAEMAPEGIQLVSENVAFSETDLTAEAPEVTVTLENKDLFWHTFTIEELAVDLRVPVGAEIPVTFRAPPGQYQFICAIPGHPEAGMVGTLTVEG